MNLKQLVAHFSIQLTKSGVISPWIVISPTTSLQSPCLSKITAQLAVENVSETLLPPVAPSGRENLRKSPFWSFPKADMSDTAPYILFKPSAMLRPTPPPENFASDLYVAPFNCTREREANNEILQWHLLLKKEKEILFVHKRRNEAKKENLLPTSMYKVLWAATRTGAYCYVSFAISIAGTKT